MGDVDDTVIGCFHLVKRVGITEREDYIVFRVLYPIVGGFFYCIYECLCLL